MKKEKICNKCQKIIDLESDKYVLLGTYNGDHILDESYFHFNCFQQWYNSKVMEKSTNTIQNATKKVMGMFGGLGRIGEKVYNDGSSTSGKILELSGEIPNLNNEIETVDLTMEIPNFSNPIKFNNEQCKKKKKKK